MQKMQLNGLFKKPHNELEKGGRTVETAVVQDVTKTCPKCGWSIPVSDLWENANVCKCGYHFRMNARQRIDFISDEGTFRELFDDVEGQDVIGFPGYDKKRKSAALSSKEKEAVVCGTAQIMGEDCVLFVMDAYYMMGSMGSAVGEKITLAFEYATEQGLPVVGFAVSGGARMQEGIISLMQMAKTSGAVKRHSDAGLLFLSVLTDPTTGGVTASFAMEGDIILAEPNALIGFAGQRVIEQTIRKKLPEGFQRAEFQQEHGFVDLIVGRDREKTVVGKLLALHHRKEGK
jgi:acetyl-CoA carboxylase carboxyl transferase subunit beta